MVPTLPLEGIRVLDLTQVYAGPSCARILADLGAEVIKVEALQRVDISRLLILTDNEGADIPWERTCYFQVRNAGKKDITLDLSNPKGREVLRRLIPHCDVLAEAFTPRVMRNFGFDYEAVRQFRPDIIMLSMSGYGQDGPHADWSAYGMGLEPASGISQVTGYRGGQPIRSGLSFTDPVAGFLAAGAVLVALHHRRRTGQGQFIDLPEQEAAIPFMGYALMEYVMNGRLPKRLGNRSPWAAPQGCYRCRGEDDWLVISVESDEEWSALCRAVGHPEWEEDERFADLLARHEHQDDLDALIETWTRDRGHIEAMHLLQRAGVKAGAVLNGKEILLDPHFREREHFDMVDHPILGRRPVNRQLVAKFDRFAAAVAGPAPLLGQHNREILQGLLGMSDGELAELEAENVIGRRPITEAPVEIWSEFLKLPLDRLLEAGALRALEPDYREQLGLEGPGGG